MALSISKSNDLFIITGTPTLSNLSNTDNVVYSVQDDTYISFTLKTQVRTTSTPPANFRCSIEINTDNPYMSLSAFGYSPVLNNEFYGQSSSFTDVIGDTSITNYDSSLNNNYLLFSAANGTPQLYCVIAEGVNYVDIYSQTSYEAGYTAGYKNGYSQGQASGSQFDGVFTLLGSAFDSAGGLMQTTIIGGLTIGTFIMIPLAITILVSIFKLIRK